MGRTEKDDLSAAQILYPCMQCADIFFLKVRFALFLLLMTTSDRLVSPSTMSRLVVYCLEDNSAEVEDDFNGF
jgi:hypothetical protein